MRITKDSSIATLLLAAKGSVLEDHEVQTKGSDADSPFGPVAPRQTNWTEPGRIVRHPRRYDRTPLAVGRGVFALNLSRERCSACFAAASAKAAIDSSMMARSRSTSLGPSNRR
jgi:hypothetical protein